LNEARAVAERIHSLRDFLEFLSEHGQCLTWPDTVMPEPDIRNVAVAAGRDAMNGPAIIFDKITGVMCEYSMEVTTKQGDWTTTVSSMLELTETNAFRSTPIPELGVIGIMGIVSAVPLAQSPRGRRPTLRRRRDPADPRDPSRSI